MATMIFALVVGGLILGVLLYVAGTWNYKYFEKLGIPYVKPVPWLGNMTSFVFRQTSLMDFIANLHKAFPDRKFIGVYEFRNPIVLVNDPELIKQITVKDFDHFIDHRFTIDPNVEPMFGRNLVSIKGNKWREMRATLSPAFTGSKMRNMFVLVTECAEELIKYLNSLESKDRTIEMKDLFTRYANDVIASAAFGLKVDSLREPNNEFYVMTKEISLFRGIQALKFFGFTAFPKLMKFLNIQMFGPRIQKFYRNLVMDTMKQRDEQNIVRPDMIHLLMQVRQGTLKHEEVVDTKDAGFATVTESEIGKSSNNITHWEDDDLTAQAVIFLFAGFETSSTLMCFVCHELALQPEIQKKLQTEIDQVRSNNNKITYEVIQSMKYLDMVISAETWRWCMGGCVRNS
ncbi:cytochrome P450 9e2-like [Ctenocephalides felis]|uniref:cytochrome P450 9e2-like n=1 Tax=Ctenocephalides felis TaxID=7515 RepID=UPI000E6E33CB|nr:cytochrome P450 9e2-like [Ctenocephalides felis]